MEAFTEELTAVLTDGGLSQGFKARCPRGFAARFSDGFGAGFIEEFTAGFTGGGGGAQS